MARLRREEEARAYERMVNNPAPHMDTFAERFPHASTRSFASVNQPMSKADLGDDDVTYADVNRQVLLIFNFLVSILGVAGTVWMAARWWSLPSRIFLTMGSSIIVGVAEVAVYSIFVWKMGDAKGRQEAVKEVKEVVDTWVLGRGDEDKESKEPVLLERKEDDNGIRKRTATSTLKDT
jgi:TMEM199 family protein